MTRPPAALCALALAAGPAAAAEVELGIGAGAEYDSNVFGVPDAVDDVDFLVRPRLRAHGEGGELQWNLHYFPTYRRYLEHSEGDGWDHDLGADVRWRLSRRTTLTLSEQFIEQSDLRSEVPSEGVLDPTLDTGAQFGRGQLRQNSVSVSLLHELARRHQVQLSASRDDTRFDRSGFSKTEVTTLGGAYIYSLRPTDSMGFALRATRQTVVPEVGPETDTDFYNVALRWFHYFSRTFTLDLTAGPALVSAPEGEEIPRVLEDQFRYPLGVNSSGILFPLQAETCPRLGDGTLFLDENVCRPFEPFRLDPENGVFFGANATETFTELVDVPITNRSAGSGDTLTYFASVTLLKRWREVTLSLSYNRDASLTTEFSGQVRDILAANLIWTPSGPFRLNLYASYTRREEPGADRSFVRTLRSADFTALTGLPPRLATVGVAEMTSLRIIEVDRDSEVVDYTLGLYASYRWSRWTQLYLQLNWTREELKGNVFPTSSWDRFLVGVGVTYWLPPFDLPF